MNFEKKSNDFDLLFQDGQQQVVKELLQHEGQSRSMPLVVRAGTERDLIRWIEENKAEFEDDLAQHGGILLRGFDINTTERFNNFMKCFNTAPLPYMFRSSPRKEIDREIKNIYLSTSYPNDRSILMHNESSYSRIWGKKIVFCCIQPAALGGETPLADSREVLKAIDPVLLQKFREKGVRYRRNLTPGLGMPWQEVFQTEKLEEMQLICEKYQIELTIKGNNHVVIEWVKPAIYQHPITGVETWFNHAYFFHKFSRYEELDMAYDDILPEEYLSSQTFFGDGTEIELDDYLNIKQAFDKNRISFPYEKGDVIFLDNSLVAHGRNPYQGDRTIATAIIEVQYQNGFVDLTT